MPGRGNRALDDTFRALAHHDRRRLLVALAARDPQRGPSVPPGPAGGEPASERRRIAFRHRHLPLLESLGFVEWDEATDTPSKGPRFDEIRPLLTLLDEHRDELPEGLI